MSTGYTKFEESAPPPLPPLLPQTAATFAASIQPIALAKKKSVTIMETEEQHSPETLSEEGDVELVDVMSIGSSSTSFRTSNNLLNASSGDLKRKSTRSFQDLGVKRQKRKNWNKIVTATNKYKRYMKYGNGNKITMSLAASELDEQTIQYDKILKWKSFALTILSFIGIALMIATQLLNWDFSRKMFIYEQRLKGENIVQLSFYHVVRFLNVIVTIIALAVLVDYYRVYAELKLKQWGFPNRWHGFWNTTLKTKFLAEFLVIVITPIPFVEKLNWPFLGDGLGLLMFMRVYLIVRVIRDFSSVYQKRLEIIKSNKKFQRTSPNFGSELVLRMLFYKHTTSTLIVTALAATLIAAFCIYVIERQVPGNPLENFMSTIYFTMVTMTTIGYGDMSPKLDLGRLAAVTIGFVGIVIVTLFSGVVINKLTPSEEQKYAFWFIQIEKYQKIRFEQAVRILQVIYLFKKKKCSHGYKHHVIKEAIKQLRAMRRNIHRYSEETNDNEDGLGRVVEQNDQLREEIRTLSLLVQHQTKLLEGLQPKK